MRPANNRTSPAKHLRAARDRFGLTLRDVEAASLRIADELKDRRFAIPHSRLNDLERKSNVPSIFRLYTLARIYKRRIRELLAWYGVPFR